MPVLSTSPVHRFLLTAALPSLASPAQTVKAGKPIVADVFVCPGYARSAPGGGSMIGRKCYLLNDNVNPDPDITKRAPPFGYPDGPIAPLKLSDLENYAPGVNVFAVTDVDKINVPNPTVSWQSDLPDRPVHGQVRNELYFDWHLAAKKVDW